MKIERSKEWWLAKAATEGDSGFSVGTPYPDVPRRICLNRMTNTERAITEIMYAIERMPANEALTEAGILLGKARDKVADYVDSIPGEITPS